MKKYIYLRENVSIVLYRSGGCYLRVHHERRLRGRKTEKKTWVLVRGDDGLHQNLKNLKKKGRLQNMTELPFHIKNTNTKTKTNTT